MGEVYAVLRMGGKYIVVASVAWLRGGLAVWLTSLFALTCIDKWNRPKVCLHRCMYYTYILQTFSCVLHSIRSYVILCYLTLPIQALKACNKQVASREKVCPALELACC